MKTKKNVLAIAVVICITVLFVPRMANSQTSGTLTFSVTTTATGAFSPRNIIAIWIKNSSNAFVKTKLKLALDVNQAFRLLLWNASSSGNIVDATTGPTQTSHATRTITWNATDVLGSVVPDGDYSVWVELAWGNNATTQKASTSVIFSKGTSAVHLTPASTTNFSGITLDWAPIITTDVEKIETSPLFSVSPNPVNSNSTVNYALTELTDVTITLYDISGRLVKVLFDDNQHAGNYSLPLFNTNLKSGLYFVKMYTGKASNMVRIFIP